LKLTADIQLKPSQWFYDDAGYYSYLLFGASEEQKNIIQPALVNGGLQVLLSGRSFRPASNGIQYQWYIRVSDEKGKHPDRAKIKAIFAFYSQTEFHQNDISELLYKISSQEEEIEKLKSAIRDKDHWNQFLFSREESLRKQNNELQAIYENSKIQLEEYRQKIQTLGQQLKQLQETTLKPDAFDQLHQEYESNIQALRQELDRKESELSSWISNFEPEIQKMEQKIADLQTQLLDYENKIAVLEAEKMDLIDNFQESRAIPEVELKKGSPEYLFREMLTLLLPHVEFLAGSFDTMWREMQNPIGVLRELTTLSEDRSKRVQKAKEWFEKHIESEWRLYYRACGGSNYQVFISHKNTQKSDIDWLSRQ